MLLSLVSLVVSIRPLDDAQLSPTHQLKVDHSSAKQRNYEQTKIETAAPAAATAPLSHEFTDASPQVPDTRGVVVHLCASLFNRPPPSA